MVGRNTDGGHVAVFTNTGGKPAYVQLKKDRRFARVVLYPESVTTLSF